MTELSHNPQIPLGEIVMVPGRRGQYVGTVVPEFLLRLLKSDLTRPSEEFLAVYFRTHSGNIYVIFGSGCEFSEQMYSSRDMMAKNLEAGDTAGIIVEGYRFELDELRDSKIQVGRQFSYGLEGKTSPIVEIVAVKSPYKTAPIQFSKPVAINAIVQEFEESAFPNFWLPGNSKKL